MNDDGSVLDGCTCHPSCGSCGYHVAAYDAFAPCETCDWPATEFDCLTCRDGLVKINLFDDGTGSCVAPQSASPNFPRPPLSHSLQYHIYGCRMGGAGLSLGLVSLPMPVSESTKLIGRYSDGVGTKELTTRDVKGVCQERTYCVSFGIRLPSERLLSA